jgi:hypothetical protein
VKFLLSAFTFLNIGRQSTPGKSYKVNENGVKFGYWPIL